MFSQGLAQNVAPGSGESQGHALHTRSAMLVTSDWLAENLEKPNVVVLQVADSSAGYRKGHIPGARFVGWEEITVTRDGVQTELPPYEELVSLIRRLGITGDSRVVLYDEGTGIYAARAYVTLDYLGLGGQAALLDGQLKKWVSEGRRLSPAEPVVVPSTFTPQPHPEVIVMLDRMRELVDRKSGSAGSQVCIIDARPPERYSGVKGSKKGEERSGHIPGAMNVPWVENIVRPDNPVLRPAEELQRLYGLAGVGADSLVVTYCGTGRSATLNYFVLKYLGYTVRLYDGSFSQWNAAPGTRVETGRPIR